MNTEETRLSRPGVLPKLLPGVVPIIKIYFITYLYVIK